MNTLIVPFDFSVHAENALGYAIGLAQQIHASVTVFHVFDVPVPAGYEDASLTYNMALASQEKKKRQTRLDRFIENLGEIYYLGSSSEQVVITTEVRQDELEESLLDFLTHRPHNLVVMGTKGVQGWEEMLQEKSNTATIAELANISVLVVPLQAQFNGIRHILYALNFDKRDLGVIQEISDFNQLFNGKITCLHVSQAHTEDTDQDKMEALEDQAIAKGLENIRFEVVEEENVEQTLFSYAQENQADILAVMPQKRNLLNSLFHKSMTKQLTHHTNMPLLVIK